MGATVTTGKLAAAFRASCGNVFYILFEETYEKNCHPHSPNWGCIYFGPLEGALKRIFAHAASCEGGMLQSRSGTITPEGYVTGWLNELKSPVELRDRSISLEVSDGFYAAIPQSKKQDVIAALEGIDRQDIAGVLAEDDPFRVTLYGDTKAIAAVCQVVPAWRIFRDYSAPTHGIRCPEIGYAPQPIKAAFDVPNFMRVDDDNRLIQKEDGTWYCGGWEYSIVGIYCQAFWESELRYPGNYRRALQAYRKAVKSAPPMPNGAVIEVDRNITLEHYDQKAVERFAAENPVTETPQGFKVDFDPALIWGLMSLPTICTAWVLPEQSDSQSEIGQLDLLAA